MAQPRRNLASLLVDLGQRPESPAFALRTPYRRFVWTAAEIRGAALGCAARLRGAGIEPGDRVVLAGPSSPEWVAGFFGIVAAGGVVVPLEESTGAEFAARVAAKVEARGAVVAQGLRSPLASARDRMVTFESLREMSRRLQPPEPIHDADPGDTAEIVFTSGTTAEPKGVELSHENLLTTLAGIEAGFERRERWLRPLLPFRLFCLVPLSHLFGQAAGLFAPILLRSVSVYPSTLKPRRLVDMIRRERPLALIAVPRTASGVAEAVLRELERRGLSMRFERGYRRAEGRHPLLRVGLTRPVRGVLGWSTWALVVGGARLEEETEEFWARCGFAVIQGYGMTEAAPIVTILNPLEGGKGSIGKRVGGQEVRLADDGEILVRGPNVMKGYYGDPAATREVLKDGWLHTGDLAKSDAEGRLYFKGRKKETIVTAEGMNVFPSDVERGLKQVRGVREAAVFGLSGPSGEEVHGAVILAGSPSTHTWTPQEILGRANELLLPHQRLRGVLVWPESDFPRTATGKVRRGEVAAAARLLRRGGARGAGEGQAAVPAELSRILAALERLRTDASAGTGGAVTARTRLAEDLGLGSLDMVELIGLLEEEHEVTLDDREVQAARTVEDLGRLVLGDKGRALRIPMPRWARRAPVRWLRALLRALVVRPFFLWFVRLEVTGRASLGGDQGPYLVVANHTSVLDAPAVLFALPGRLRGALAPAMAIETLPDHLEPEGKPVLRRARSWFLTNLAVLLFNAYPMPQSRGYRPSLEYTGELLDSGFSPLIFPEGRMTLDGRMHAFKNGIGLLALETRARILPVRLEGLGELLPPDARWPRRGRARVVLGQPFDPLEIARAVSDLPGGPDGGPSPPASASSQAPEEITARIENAVRRLSGEREADTRCPDRSA